MQNPKTTQKHSISQPEISQYLPDELVIKEIVQIIKKEANLSCSICLYDYDPVVRYPVQTCSNKHSFCKVCLDSFKPSSSKVNISARNSLLNQTLVPCPNCKAEFVKENAQRNRIIESLAVEVIPRVKNTLAEYIRIKKNQTDELIMKKAKQVKQTLHKEITMLQRQGAKRKQDSASLKLQIAKLNSECNIYRGLPELNTISAQTIKLLSQENDKLTTQLHILRSQFVKNYTLFAGKSYQLVATNKKKGTNILTEKLIRQKIAQRQTFKEAKSQFHKCIYFVITSSLDTLQILELKNIEMTGEKFLILLRIQFKNLKKLVLSHNRISIEKAIYYLQNLELLQQLDLSFNQIKNLPTNLVQIQHLKTLNLQANHLQQFDDILKLKNLLSLNLKSNPISQQYCRNIKFAGKQFLDLQLSCNLKMLVQNNRLSLKKLSFSEVRLAQQINQLLQHQEFQELILDKCISFVSFSAKINFSNLISLTLKNNLIQKLSLKQISFSLLKKVVIIEPYLQDLSDSLLRGKKIQFFQLQSQQLKYLPAQLKFNTSMKYIRIKIKELSVFPQFLYQLKQLQAIHLENLYLFDLVSEAKDYFISQRITELSSLREIVLRSLIKMEIDVSSLLQALDSDVRNCPLKRFQLQNFIISSQTFQQITKLSQLQTLVLVNGFIESLPTNIQKLRKLASLRLSQNLIKALPDSFSNLKNLQSLDLSKNPMRNLPQKIIQLPKLFQLNFDFEQQQLNYQKDIYLTFQLHQRQIKFVQQQKFDIAVFIEKNISPCSYSQLIQQENELDIQQSAKDYQNYKFNQINDLSAFQKFKQLPFYRLTQLSLSSANLTNADVCVPNLPFQFVKRLDLCKNKLKLGKKQALFRFLPSLQILDVSFNLIDQIPQDFSSLSKIRKLNISHNLFNIIPKPLYTSRYLQILDLSYNQITGVEEEIQHSTTLTELNLQANKMTVIPFFAFLSPLLQEININYNHSKFKLTNQLSKLKCLRRLKANGLIYNAFPSHLFAIKDIQQLYIDAFNYRSVSGTVVLPTAKNIKQLSLEGYQFSEIPLAIYQLKTLEKLNLSKNSIQVIDQGISQLVVLRTLELRFNKINAGCINLNKLPLLFLVDLNFNEIANKSERSIITSLMCKVIVLYSFAQAQIVEAQSLKTKQKDKPIEKFLKAYEVYDHQIQQLDF